MIFGVLDGLILALYAVAVLGVGLWAGRRERDTVDYFLGGRRQHWLAVGMSIVATEVSALTFINVPAEAFRGDWTYLQMYAGAFVGRVIVVFLLLPAFYGSEVTTVYEYLGQRFGPWTRTTASLMYFVSRIVGSGIRLLAASLAIATVFDWPLFWVILGIAAVAVAYTTVGGIKAIIWTDVLQAITFLGCAGIAVVLLFVQTPGTWGDQLAAAYDAGKFHVFTWDRSSNNPNAFWVLFIHATILNMAAFGIDQDMTQRMLTCSDLRRGQRSLLFNAFVGLPVVCLFLLIGSLLFVFFQRSGTQPPAGVLEQTDRIFPHFIAQVIPAGYGLKGLMIAGLLAAAMSSLDSTLGAMSSSAVTDLYRPMMARRRRKAVPRQLADACGEPHAASSSDAQILSAARWFTFGFGVLLVVVALAFSRQDKLLWAVFRWVSLVVGGMLGIFLLAVITRKRGHDRFNPVAMLSSVLLLVALELWQRRGEELGGMVVIAWPWYVVMGTAWTYLLAACRSTKDQR